MALGLVCHYIEEVRSRSGKVSYKNLFENRTLQLGRWQRGEYTDERVFETYLHNAGMLLKILPLVVSKGIRHYRLSSELIPLGDKVPRSLWDNDQLRGTFKQVGDFCRQHGMRITMHPGQFCVLNSGRDDVVENAMKDLAQHAWIMDACQFDMSPYYAINIHAGKRDSWFRLQDSIEKLPDNIRSRLTFENCETVANVQQLCELHAVTSCPVVFDSHHHTFNPGSYTLEQAFDEARRTWPSHIRPLQHVANTEPGLENGSFSERRKHSFFMHSIPEAQREANNNGLIDLELECKSKNIGLLKLSRELGVNLV